METVVIGNYFGKVGILDEKDGILTGTCITSVFSPIRGQKFDIGTKIRARGTRFGDFFKLDPGAKIEKAY